MPLKASSEINTLDDHDSSSSNVNSESISSEEGYSTTDLSTGKQWESSKIYSPPPALFPLPSFKHNTLNDEETKIQVDFFPQKVSIDEQLSYMSSLLQHDRETVHAKELRCFGGFTKRTLRVPKWFLAWRTDFMEFVFQTFSCITNRIRDNVLFSAIDFFDIYVGLQLQFQSQDAIKKESKELFIAALILASKLENVRHLSVRICCELIGLPTSYKERVMEKEMSLFLNLHPVLHCASACPFICGLLNYDSGHRKQKRNKEDTREVAYHLAVYILALNIVDMRTRLWSAQQLGTACAWIVTLLLRCPMTPVMEQLAVTVNSQEYSTICHQVMKRALQECQKTNSSINLYFASASRCRVAEILRKAAGTATGNIFLSR